MIRIQTAITLLCLPVLLVFAGISNADEPLSAEFRADIQRLLGVIEARNLVQMGAAISTQVIADEVQKVKPAVRERAAEAIKDEAENLIKEKIDELVNNMIPIYAKYLTQEEVRALISFYETPVGKKYIAVMPQMVNESVQVGQAWGRRLGTELGQRIKKRFQVEGIL